MLKTLAIPLVLLLAQMPPAVKEIAKPCTLMASAETVRLCGEALMRATQAEMDLASAGSAYDRKKAQELVDAAKENQERTCKAAKLVPLAAGTTVEVSSRKDVCEEENRPSGWARVRIKAGKDAGTIGCVLEENLRDPVPF